MVSPSRTVQVPDLSLKDESPFIHHGKIDPQRHRTVMIVDDELTGRLILSKVVQQVADDITVVDFDNAIDALAWLDDHQVDLIITDYKMPDMDGIHFIKAVRRKPNNRAVPMMMITVVSEKAVRYDALDAGVTAFLTRPIDQIECRTSCRNLLKLHEQHLIIQNRAEWLTEQVHIATEQIVLRERETLLRLAKAGEYRDEETGNHVIRMAKYAREIAEEIGLTPTECADIEYAAPMHDIGKIGISDNILLKSGKLDKQEWAIMQSHTTIGYEILSNSESRYMQKGAIIALYHHERFDGKGYPNGLRGSDIPLIARIVTVADIYDALLSVRPYKEAWPAQKAIDYIKEQAGTQLDPKCVNAFIKRLPQITAIQHEYADI